MNHILKNKNLYICLLISLILGALAFIWIFGTIPLNPMNTDWIFSSHSDLMVNYIGWLFFRDAEWTFPLGSYNTLSYPVYTSVLNPSSLPIFAILFKIFSNVLPRHFQYFGYFGILCYMAQSSVGMLIARKYTRDDFLGNTIAILCGLMFVFMPILANPMYWHTALSSQTLILASFLPIVYDKDWTLKRKLILYGIIGLIAGATQPYFIVLCSMIIFSFCIIEYIKTKDIKAFSYIACFVSSAAFALYLIGGFAMNSKFIAPYLLRDSFNLNGFFNSFGQYRFFANMEYYDINQQVGMAYWGIGVILLVCICLISIFVKYKYNNIIESFKNHKSEIIVVSLLLALSFILSLSPRITLGNIILADINYPKFIIKLWSVLRVTGRFIWIVNYSILLFLIIYVLKNFSRKTICIILTLCLSIQIYDFVPLLKMKNYNLKMPLKRDFFTQAPVWQNICKDNPNIKVVYIDPLMYETSNIYDLDLAFWAYDNHLYYNDFDFSRPVRGLNEIYFDKLQNPDSVSLFVFAKEHYSGTVIQSSGLKYFYVIEPLILGTNFQIKGLENYSISKEKIVNEKTLF